MGWKIFYSECDKVQLSTKIINKYCVCRCTVTMHLCGDFMPQRNFYRKYSTYVFVQFTHGHECINETTHQEKKT